MVSRTVILIEKIIKEFIMEPGFNTSIAITNPQDGRINIQVEYKESKHILQKDGDLAVIKNLNKPAFQNSVNIQAVSKYRFNWFGRFLCFLGYASELNGSYVNTR